MLLNNVLMLAAIVLQCLAPLAFRYELYIAGQFVQGLGASFTPALVLFMAESVPDRFRGRCPAPRAPPPAHPASRRHHVALHRQRQLRVHHARRHRRHGRVLRH